MDIYSEKQPAHKNRVRCCKQCKDAILNSRRLEYASKTREAQENVRRQHGSALLHVDWTRDLLQPLQQHQRALTPNRLCERQSGRIPLNRHPQILWLGPQLLRVRSRQWRGPPVSRRHPDWPTTWLLPWGFWSLQAYFVNAWILNNPWYKDNADQGCVPGACYQCNKTIPVCGTSGSGKRVVNLRQRHKKDSELINFNPFKTDS